ncbi:Gfo/Idh/MocA family protein [Tardiphaga sp. 866_E4_N2_1]|uniref:Gfo/Idh/MocA family protein n=1 Tax=unclassified Tardiphaga TaxID=2631404 RepID=UPI003F27ED10
MIKAAIVGLGWWGQTIAAALADSKVMKPVLGIDPNEAACDKAAALGLEIGTSFAEVLTRPDIDAVILCTPTEQHADQIVAVASTGKHIFCEKPLCTTEAEAERAIAAVQAAKIKLGFGHERRFMPAILEMRRRLADGEFGNAMLVEGNFSHDKMTHLSADSWRFSNTINPVGPLSAPGIHMVDLSIAILGRPKNVLARLSTLGTSFPNGDTLAISIGFESGAAALLTAILATPFMGRFAVFGSKGWMEVRDRSHPENSTGWDVTRKALDGDPISAYYPPHPAIRDNLEAFGRAVMGGDPYPVTHEEMLMNVRTFAAIRRSVVSGAIEDI